MIKEALQYIVDLGKVAVSEINGSQYSTGKLFRIPGIHLAAEGDTAKAKGTSKGLASLFDDFF